MRADFSGIHQINISVSVGESKRYFQPEDALENGKSRLSSTLRAMHDGDVPTRET